MYNETRGLVTTTVKWLMMELNYTVSRRDIASIVRGVTKAVWRRPENSKRKLMLQALNILLWVPVGFFIAYSFSKSESLGRWALYGIGLGAGVVWIYRLIERRALNQLPNEPGPSLGPLKLVADENGVTVEGTDSKSVTQWAGVKNIEEVGGYVLVFIDNHVAHYIPKAAIGGEADVEKFIDEIASLRERYAT